MRVNVRSSQVSSGHVGSVHTRGHDVVTRARGADVVALSSGEQRLIGELLGAATNGAEFPLDEPWRYTGGVLTGYNLQRKLDRLASEVGVLVVDCAERDKLDPEIIEQLTELISSVYAVSRDSAQHVLDLVSELDGLLNEM